MGESLREEVRIFGGIGEEKGFGELETEEVKGRALI